MVQILCSLLFCLSFFLQKKKLVFIYHFFYNTRKLFLYNRSAFFSSRNTIFIISDKLYFCANLLQKSCISFLCPSFFLKYKKLVFIYQELQKNVNIEILIFLFDIITIIIVTDPVKPDNIFTQVTIQKFGLTL